MSTAVYVANAGATPAATPAAMRPIPGNTPVSPLAVAIPFAAEKALKMYVPTLIGELGLNTRSMWWKRAGRPRSMMRQYALTRDRGGACKRQSARRAFVAAGAHAGGEHRRAGRRAAAKKVERNQRRPLDRFENRLAVIGLLFRLRSRAHERDNAQAKSAASAPAAIAADFHISPTCFVGTTGLGGKP